MPVWHAPRDLVVAGYRPERVELGHLIGNAEALKARCTILQAEVRYWVATQGARPAADFDGSIRALCSLYENHPESRFHALKPGPHRAYRTVLQRLRAIIGERQVETVTGVDLMRWRRDWGGDEKPAMANQMRVVLLAAVSFGCALRLASCVELAATLKAARSSFKSNPPRKVALTYAQVVAVCEAAVARGRLYQAIAYAIMFETTLRLADVVGVWWPAARKRPSLIADAATGDTWFGLCWEDIADDGILRYQPSKTTETTGKTIAFPLRLAPLATRYLKRVPLLKRSGPIVIDQATGLPFRTSTFNDGWHLDRDAAGLPKTVWARDLRASGITEGRSAGASLDDAAMVAGHAGSKTTGEVYDRANLAAAERFAAARLEFRDRGPAATITAIAPFNDREATLAPTHVNRIVDG